jgi:uncharacterized membrane protein
VPDGKRDHHVLYTRAQKASDAQVSWQNRAADAMTAFSGSMPFVYLHVIWFAAWLLCNEGVFGKSLIFDPFPFGLLTLIVSLEAIFLSTFVLISQNRQQERADRRSQADYENDIRAEAWSIHLGQKLGVDQASVEADVQRRLRNIPRWAPASSASSTVPDSCLFLARNSFGAVNSWWEWPALQSTLNGPAAW